MAPPPSESQLPTKPHRSPHEIAREAFAHAFHETTLDLDALLPHRVPVVTRIVREMARHRSLIEQHETLADRLDDTFDNDFASTPIPFSRPTIQNYQRNLCAEIAGRMILAQRLPPEWHIERPDPDDAAKTVTLSGVALFPPPIPSRFIDEHGGVIVSYDPYKDQALMAFIDIIEATARYLAIDERTREEIDLGAQHATAWRYGMAGLLDPEIIRQAWPGRFQIVTWEQMLIEATLDALSGRGTVATRKALAYRFGMTQIEIGCLCKLAIGYARQIHDMDADDARALMVNRLEDFSDRARTGLDLRAELMAIKTTSIVQGLSRGEAEDSIKDIISAVRKVSGERQTAIPSLPE